MSYPILGLALTATPSDSTTADTRFEVGGFTLGQTAIDADGNEYIYVHAAGAITQYAFVAIDSAFEAAMITHALAVSEARFGAAQVAFADNDYGWVLIKGSGSVLCKTLCATDVQLYSSGTDGYIDDADITSSRPIVGIRINTTVGGADAAAACVLSYPTTVTLFDSTT